MSQATFEFARTGDPDTSHQAAQSIQPGLSRLERLVMDELRALHWSSHGEGATAFEISRALAVRGHPVETNSVSRRLTSLRRDGFAEWSGEKRPGRSGRPQRVNIPVEATR